LGEKKLKKRLKRFFKKIPCKLLYCKKYITFIKIILKGKKDGEKKIKEQI